MLKKWNSLTEMFFDQAATQGTKPFLFHKVDKQWRSLSWREVASEIAKVAEALQKIGVARGDRVLLVSENRPEFFIADFAIMAVGAISVPTYTTYTERDYQHICDNSGARAAIVSTSALAAKILPAAHESDDLHDVIIMEDHTLEQSINCTLHTWYDLIKDSAGDVAAYAAKAAAVERGETATIIYTSGTGGSPKGVMLPHGAMLHNIEAAYPVVEAVGPANNRFLSFLPLSHAYEHTCGQFLPVGIAAEIWYSEGLEKLAVNIEETSPTIMVVVPRLFEMLRTRLLRQMDKSPAFTQKLFHKAIELGTLKAKGMKLSPLQALLNGLLTVLVRKKVQKKFGGRMKALVSGGAPLSPDVGYFFEALGLPLLQGYGQTESAPLISVNLPNKVKMHTVGKIVAGLEAKIAEDGEILVRGESVMQGYWRNKTATDKTIIDGWLHTGDVGTLDADNYLEITDRKKDIIVNDKGDNVSPQRIEGLLSLRSEIAQAMVYGDRKPHLVGLIVPDQEWLAEWASANGKSTDLADLQGDNDFKRALTEAVKEVNGRLTNLEKVRNFTIADAPFSIENKQMTPSLKVRRHMVVEQYGERLEGLYRR